MTGPTPFAQGTARPTSLAAAAATFGVRTNAVDRAHDDLQRAVDRGRQLLEHPGTMRGRAQDGGDDDLRDAVALFANRWQWGLQVLVDDAAALARDMQLAARLYDEAEHLAIPMLAPSAGHGATR